MNWYYTQTTNEDIKMTLSKKKAKQCFDWSIANEGVHQYAGAYLSLCGAIGWLSDDSCNGADDENHCSAYLDALDARDSFAKKFVLPLAQAAALQL